MLSGVIAARDVLRHTPAGLPVLDFLLQHESEQSEAGQTFHTQVEVQVSASGQAALDLDRQATGTRILIRGFLARKSRHSRQLIVRTEQYKLIDGE